MIALLAAGGFLSVLLSIAFILVCLMLIFMVVITPSNEGGMAAAFGGMGSESFFGSKAHTQINKFTVFLAVSFLALALAINFSNVGAKKADVGGKTETEEKMDKLPKPPPQPGAPGQFPVPQPGK